MTVERYVASTCSCGDHAVHVVAAKRTNDGKRVLLWSDGMLTWALGYRIRGVGVARSHYERKLNLEAGWVVAGLCAVLDATEIPSAIAAARRELRADIKGSVGIDSARLERLTLTALRLGAR